MFNYSGPDAEIIMFINRAKAETATVKVLLIYFKGLLKIEEIEILREGHV